MLKDKIVEQYIREFLDGKSYNYYIDSLRYKSSDTWFTKDDWIKIAKECIFGNHNILQALEILIVEEYDKYYSMADKVLTEWYDAGGYDIQYYHDIIAFMPKDYPIRKKIVGDYSDYLENYSIGNDTFMRASLIRSNDIEFCNIYGKYLDKEIQRNKDNFDELASMVNANYIFDLGKEVYKYVEKDSLDIVKNMIFEYIQKDKEMALKILDGYMPNIDEEQTLWIIDYVPRIAFCIGWNDVLEYLLYEDWYWLFLFDEDFGYENDNNQNLLIWSQYTKNNTLLHRAKDLFLKENEFFKRFDGFIALSRLGNS